MGFAAKFKFSVISVLLLLVMCVCMSAKNVEQRMSATEKLNISFVPLVELYEEYKAVITLKKREKKTTR